MRSHCLQAALCAIRVFNKVPDMIPDFLPKIAGLLSDKSHSVLLTGLTLMVEVCNISPPLVPRFNKVRYVCACVCECVSVCVSVCLCMRACAFAWLVHRGVCPCLFQGRVYFCILMHAAHGHEMCTSACFLISFVA